jgi:hypothetical protein
MRGRNRTLPPERWIHPAASTHGSPGCRMNPAFHSRDGLAVLSVRIVTSREDFPSRMFFLPLPATEEWGEERGEGHSSFRPQTRLLSPALSSRAWRRGSLWLRLCRAMSWWWSPDAPPAQSPQKLTCNYFGSGYSCPVCWTTCPFKAWIIFK